MSLNLFEPDTSCDALLGLTTTLLSLLALFWLVSCVTSMFAMASSPFPLLPTRSDPVRILSQLPGPRRTTQTVHDISHKHSWRREPFLDHKYCRGIRCCLRNAPEQERPWRNGSYPVQPGS